MRWKNFRVWRGKLPHWRADDVRYFVTFRHRRELDETERLSLFRHLLRQDGRKLEVLILCVLPRATELVFSVQRDAAGNSGELSEAVEKAKLRAGKEIVKRSGERYPPFYSESFDRIIRDEIELEERWQAIFESPVESAGADESASYPTLFVAAAPSQPA